MASLAIQAKLEKARALLQEIVQDLKVEEDNKARVPTVQGLVDCLQCDRSTRFDDELAQELQFLFNSEAGILVLKQALQDDSNFDLLFCDIIAYSQPNIVLLLSEIVRLRIVNVEQLVDSHISSWDDNGIRMPRGPIFAYVATFGEFRPILQSLMTPALAETLRKYDHNGTVPAWMVYHSACPKALEWIWHLNDNAMKYVFSPRITFFGPKLYQEALQRKNRLPEPEFLALLLKYLANAQAEEEKLKTKPALPSLLA